MKTRWITASEIKDWLNRNKKNCEQMLPYLIRRLILFQAKGEVEEFDFPCGDSVATQGWDARLTVSCKTPYFPTGISRWEMGTSGGIKAKADDDYAKRTKEPLGANPNLSTFVFVTPRPWPQRHSWTNEKKKLNDWKDVVVIAADNLETWLEESPPVALWLARQIGVNIPLGIQDIEEKWEQMTAKNNALSVKNITNNRTSDIELIKNWLKGDPQILHFEDDNFENSYALLYSTISCSDIYLSRTIIVPKKEVLNELVRNFSNLNLILIVESNCEDLIDWAVKKGNYVFYIKRKSITTKDPVCLLVNPPDTEDAIHANSLVKNINKVHLIHGSSYDFSIDYEMALKYLNIRGDSWQRIVANYIIQGLENVGVENFFKSFETISSPFIVSNFNAHKEKIMSCHKAIQRVSIEDNDSVSEYFLSGYQKDMGLKGLPDEHYIDLFNDYQKLLIEIFEIYQLKQDS